VKSTNYEVPHHAILSFFLLVPLSQIKIFSSALCFQTPSTYILPLGLHTKCYTHINKRWNYSFVHFNHCILRQELRRQQILKWIIVSMSISRIYSTLNIFLNVILICYVTLTYLIFVTLLKDYLALFILWLSKALCWWDMNLFILPLTKNSHFATSFSQ
jgi:hypothetical protein